MVLYSGLVSVVVCALLAVAISRPFRGFPAALGCFSGLQGGYLRYNEPKDRIRIDLKPQIKKIDLDGALLWLGFGRGVRVVGSGDFGRFVVFLPLWGASAACRVDL